MNHAIRVLQMEAMVRGGMTTPNASTISEYTANENKRIVAELERAIALLKLDKGISDLSESCHRNAERKVCHE